MKIVKNTAHDCWIVTEKFVALVSYGQIIALQSINTNELVIVDSKLTRTSKMHLNRLMATCTGYMITSLPQRDLLYTAIDLLNASDEDPYTTDDNKSYTLSAILGDSYALELLERYHGINPVHGRIRKDQFYAVHNDTYAIMYTGSCFLYFEAHEV